MMRTTGTRTAHDRFWEKVQKSDRCWKWTGKVEHQRYAEYGRFYFDRREVYAHRWSYEQANGPVPRGLEIDHLCRNQLCVRPSHLEAVTHLENMRRSATARKTHCVNGHEFTPANTRVVTLPNGWRRRYCRICVAAKTRAYLRRKAAA